jgi:predicted transcriptional regulator
MPYVRSRLEITCDILLFIKNEEEEAKPTHILYKANLSPDLLKKYLGKLMRDGLINRIEKDGKARFKITEKGLKFLKTLDSLNEITDLIEIYQDRRINTKKKSVLFE